MLCAEWYTSVCTSPCRAHATLKPADDWPSLSGTPALPVSYTSGRRAGEASHHRWDGRGTLDESGVGRDIPVYCGTADRRDFAPWVTHNPGPGGGRAYLPSALMQQ
eukprot:9055194-Pyramimonas_sp.AAC.1